jgi:hypothetical protein
VIFFSPPFCTGYAYHAWRGTSGKWTALAGFVLAGVELLALVGLMVIGAVAAMG